MLHSWISNLLRRSLIFFKYIKVPSFYNIYLSNVLVYRIKLPLNVNFFLSRNLYLTSKRKQLYKHENCLSVNELKTLKSFLKLQMCYLGGAYVRLYVINIIKTKLIKIFTSLLIFVK